MSLLDSFPRDCLPEPREQQIVALNKIEAAIKNRKTFIVVESPVGSGKSGIAVTLGRASKSAFILTPSKSLQNQYLSDFPDVRLSKGRSSIPCTYNKPNLNQKVIGWIKNGEDIPLPQIENSCAKGACIGTTNGTRKRILAECEQSGQCPYDAMLEEAAKAEIVVLNYHAMFYQTYHAGKFDKRKILCLDEAHDTEAFLRSMLSVTFTIHRMVAPAEVKHLKSPEHWAAWLKRQEQQSTIKKEHLETYLGKIEKFEAGGVNTYGEKAITRIYHHDTHFKVEFTPNYVGNAAREFLFQFADIVIFLTGTGYDKSLFLNPLGIATNDAEFIRLESDFPVENRPIVLPRNPNLDLSHKNWSANLPQAISEINHIMTHHATDKGVIHCSSYKMSEELALHLKSKRIITHTSENFSSKLAEFYASAEPSVFLSPTCNQGVDMKGDLARFSIIIRPAYPTTDDPFMKSMLDNNRWDYYNYKTLITLGQQTGRIVRSSTDYGVVYLLDSRFLGFLQKVKYLLQPWFIKGLVK